VTVLDIRRRTGVLFLAVMLGHLILISAQVTTKSGLTTLEAIVFGAVAGVQRASSWAIDGVTGAWGRYVDLRRVRDDNARLERELAALRLQLQAQQALALRGTRLELLLGLQRAVPQRTLAADVIAGDASAWFRTVTINRGSRDGVRRDLAVIAPGGAVGRIVGDPTPHAARVQLLIDRNAGAGALVERSRAGGVVVGDGSAFVMEFVSSISAVNPGDIVVTSGLDRIFAKGVVLGTVRQVERGAGVYRRIAIAPAVDFSALEEVLVVMDPPPAVPAGGGVG
jgi:rod shape-determining protein MreC